MLACKGIFVKPSITQACDSTHRAKPNRLSRKRFCVYYIISYFRVNCKNILCIFRKKGIFWGVLE